MVQLHYFTEAEFIRDGTGWHALMACDLLVKLDVLRHQWGQPILISGHRRALGRRDGDSPSQHNVDRWGDVRAADIQPEGITSQGMAYAFKELATDCGFTGIGFYPNWKPSAGFHLDVRRDRKPGDPATWGFLVRGNRLVQTSINDAFDVMA